tara:strand:- start:128 stop:331 length:204 start_codon:yes stop_codon:yes gene_type:complete
MDWQTLKSERRTNLMDSDKFMLSDYPITNEEKTELMTFRQTLRDLPQDYETAQEAFDNYPEIPECMR